MIKKKEILIYFSVEISCGGNKRSYDYYMDDNGSFTCAYIKGSYAHLAYSPLAHSRKIHTLVCNFMEPICMMPCFLVWIQCYPFPINLESTECRGSTYLLTASEDSTMRLTNLDRMTCIQTIFGHISGVKTINFSK